MYQKRGKKSYKSICERLFRTTKNSKQPKCPSPGKWINKPWHLAIKRKPTDTCDNIDKPHGFMLGERSQTQNATYYMNSSYTRKRQNTRAENRPVIAGPGGCLQGAWEKFKVIEILCILIVVVVIQMCKFVKIHKTVCLKGANFTVYKVYFSKCLFQRSLILALLLPGTLSKLWRFYGLCFPHL